MKKYIIILIGVFVVTSCTNNKTSESTEKNVSDIDNTKSNFCTNYNVYPNEIKKHKLFRFFNDAKWLFYACNFNCTFYESNIIVKDYRLISHELEIHAFYEDSLVYLGFLPMFSSIENYQKDLKVVSSKDKNYFDSFATSKDCDSIKYRHPSGALAFPSLEIYFNEPEKYKEGVISLRKDGINPINEQLMIFEEYLRTTSDTLTEWLKCEAKRRGILKE